MQRVCMSNVHPLAYYSGMAKKPEPRTLKLIVRISPPEKREIERRAEKAQRSVSDYVRLAAIGTGPKNNAPG